MALDTKSKRGSATTLAMPFRLWLTEPNGTIAVGPRIALLKLCSAEAPAGVVFDTTVPASREWDLDPDPREWDLDPDPREWELEAG